MSHTLPPIDQAALGPPAAPVASLGARAAAFFRLTKPRVIELLLVTSVPPMVLAEGGWPEWSLVVAVVVGGAMAAGGANTINSFIERDRDQLMRRTSGRPLPRGEVTPRQALWFGIGLNVIAFAVLWWAANLLAALLTMSATLFYVFVYTIWLKPRTEQNIVIGGAAGAVPVLVGWAAVTDSLAAPAWLLFAVIFLWTPAHFWALAVKYRDDYAAAGIPMLPVRRSERATASQITAYAAATVVASMLLGLTTPVGPVYVIGAAIIGALLVAGAASLLRDCSQARAIRFFGYSNLYLATLFALVAVDTLLR